MGGLSLPPTHMNTTTSPEIEAHNAEVAQAAAILAEHRATWPEGEWTNELDRLEFEHAGLPCIMQRNALGNWCGYVAVSPGHILYGVDARNIDIEVHGGLTYANACMGAVCHIPKPGEPDDVWWLGFDAAHAGDRVPEMAFSITTGEPREWETYRDQDYIKEQTEGLADQLAALR